MTPTPTTARRQSIWPDAAAIRDNFAGRNERSATEELVRDSCNCSAALLYAVQERLRVCVEDVVLRQTHTVYLITERLGETWTIGIKDLSTSSMTHVQ